MSHRINNAVLNERAFRLPPGRRVAADTRSLELRPDGPHSPAYTTQVAWGVADAVHVLIYATGSHVAAGLPTPATAHEVLGALRTAALGLPQLFNQFGGFLAELLDAGRLADHVRDPAVSVSLAEDHLVAARAAAQALEREVERAQAAINGLYIPDHGDAPGGEGR
jgi:hypothetical protein